MKDDNSPPLILSPSHLILWTFAVAFFGVFVAVPLRRQFIVKEKLVFPSGTATAQLISVLHAIPPPGMNNRRKRGDYQRLAMADELTFNESEPEVEVEATKIDQAGWTSLISSFSISALYTLLSLAFPVINAIPLFDLFYPSLAHSYLFWFSPSFSYIGQGIIMGFPTTASMNLGMLVGWAFLSPLSKSMGWAPGEVASSRDGARGWILWPALAVMMAEVSKTRREEAEDVTD